MPGPTGFYSALQNNFGTQDNFGSQRGGAGNQANPQFMNMLLPALMSVGGAAIGGMNAPKGLDYEQIQKMFGSQQLVGDTNNLFQMMMGSPMMTSQMQGASTLGNRFKGNLSKNIGQSGLGGTPMAGTMKAAGMGYGGQLRLQAQQQMFQQAMQMAMQQQQQQMGMFNQQQQVPNFWQQFGSAMLGGGAQGFLK